jgi:hypothetical protein
MEQVAGNHARDTTVEGRGMLWIIEIVVAVGFLISVAMSIEAAAARYESTEF